MLESGWRNLDTARGKKKSNSHMFISQRKNKCLPFCFKKVFLLCLQQSQCCLSNPTIEQAFFETFFHEIELAERGVHGI